ncbi:hypothetical protein [Pistricoccus aurantiacus]|uniref:hypothetical protein n=1 Tax=Pistricoccus aurantiacus TaxID=1883414 RepID=UPI0036310213
MFNNIFVFIKWFKSLSAKFVRVVPVFTMSIVILNLVSQLATLLASVLPLKVVIMLSSEGIPRYFPSSFAAIDRDILIAALSAGTVGFFLLHLLAERMINWVTSVSTLRLLAMSQKMVLFENQEEVAASSYQRYSRALASGVFVALALLGLGFFYPAMSVVIIGYFLLVFFLLWGLQHQSLAFREHLESKLSDVLNLAKGVGFFVAFGFLVGDFIFWSPPSVIIAVVSLLLSRQIMQRATGMIGDLTSLSRQQSKLDALFFHGKVLLPQQTRPEKTLWPLLAPERRQAWVSAVLNELVSAEEAEVICHWHQLATPNITGLKITSGKCRYLVKLFEVNRSSWALHEATLIADPASRLPAPNWIGATQVQKFHCLVYELPQGEQPEARQVKEYGERLREELLTVQPQSEAVKRYLRSKAMLWQRLDASFIERLYVAADSAKQQDDLAALLDRLPHLQQQLKALPVVLHNPDIRQESMWISTAGTDQPTVPILLNWERWSLEPVGSGWPEAEKSLASLGEAMQSAAEHRKELDDIKVEQAELASLAFALEREYNRQRYVQALELVPPMLDRLAVLETVTQPGVVDAG